MRGALFLAALVGLCWGSREERPAFTRTEDGKIHALIPDIPGAVNVVLTLKDDEPEFGGKTVVTSAATQGKADGYWRTTTADVTDKDGDVHYVIEYQFPSGEHQRSGVFFLGTKQDTALTPNSPRYLHRRATTVFYDDFSSGHVDTHKWRVEVSADGVGGHKFQMYTPEARNVYIKNGMLFLRPTLTVDRFGNDFLAHGTLDARAVWGTCTNNDCVRHGWNEIHPIMSGMVRSNGHIKYGKVEVVAKLPKGDWLWPAIWLMPVKPFAYGGWPRSGEIDIMEAACNEHLTYQDGSSAGVDVTHATIHYGPNREGHKRHGNIYRIPGTTFGNDFHTYWMDWTESHIKLGVDDHTTVMLNTPSNGFWHEGGFTGTNIWAHGGHNAPFDQPFYLILNVAVGGEFFWDGYVNHPYPKPWHSDDNNQMMEFWNARNKWLPTWHGEDVAMRIRSVKMQQY